MKIRRSKKPARRGGVGRSDHTTLVKWWWRGGHLYVDRFSGKDRE